MNTRKLFIQDPESKKIRLTKASREQYEHKFGEVGFDVRKIKSMKVFEAAVDASFTNEMQKLASNIKGKDAELDFVLKGLPGWD